MAATRVDVVGATPRLRRDIDKLRLKVRYVDVDTVRNWIPRQVAVVCIDHVPHIAMERGKALGDRVYGVPDELVIATLKGLE